MCKVAYKEKTRGEEKRRYDRKEKRAREETQRITTRPRQGVEYSSGLLEGQVTE